MWIDSVFKTPFNVTPFVSVRKRYRLTKTELKSQKSVNRSLRPNKFQGYYNKVEMSTAKIKRFKSFKLC